MQFRGKGRHISRYCYALVLSLGFAQDTIAISPAGIIYCSARSGAASSLPSLPNCHHKQYEEFSSPTLVLDRLGSWPSNECTEGAGGTLRHSGLSCYGHTAMVDAEPVNATIAIGSSDPEGSSEDSGNELREISSFQSFLAEAKRPQPRVQWKSLMAGSTMYLGVMHAFRLATEPSTRAALHNSVFGGYFKALGAMHGWSDGDGYYENYLGHPIEGAVASYIWIHNDPRYRGVEFGRSRDYWMSRLRAFGYSWAFSEQFEIGLTSEATIGQIQRYCCAYGFVDHVITPTMGMVWVIGGDMLDRYVVRPIEGRTQNPVTRALARSALNIPQTFANVMALRYPWHRENRAGVHEYQGQLYVREPTRAESNSSLLSNIPTVELFASVPAATRYGGRSCIGGYAMAGFRVATSWQWTGEVGGCTLGKDLPRGWSGDSLTFLTGPQWVMHTDSRWSPHAHVRVGGQKITEDYCLQYGAIEHMLRPAQPCKTDPSGYPKHYEATGPAMSLGTGVDLRLNRALELRVAQLEYLHAWHGTIHGTDFSQGIRFTMGLGLKIGTW